MPAHFAAVQLLADDWLPTGSQLRVGLIAVVISLLIGLAIYVALRKFIHRARLFNALVVTTLTAAVYFAFYFADPSRLSEPDDKLAYWIKRICAAAILFAGLRALDRLVIVPILTRGGKAQASRFVHQVVNIVIFLFAVMVYGSRAFGWDINQFLAGSAVVSIVLGLALQETLGNFFSGLVMQASNPFAIGDWIECAGVEGRVVEMTWRAVTIHTPDDNHVLIPNGTIAKEQIVNHHSPTPSTARSIDVGLEYDLPPGRAMEVLKKATLEAHGVLASPEPFVYLKDFADSAIVYHIKFWLNEPAKHKKIEHEVRTNIWYRLRQNGFNIPFPIRTVEHVPLRMKTAQLAKSATEERYQALTGLWILQPLTEEQKRGLAADAADVLLHTGQVLLRQGDPGASLYIIRRGEVDVLVAPDGKTETRVAGLKAGDFFGELSALTGAPRSATIRAASDVELIEICKEPLNAIFQADPGMMEKISRVMAERTAHREAAIQSLSAQSQEQAVVQQQKSLLSRMLGFFKGIEKGN